METGKKIDFFLTQESYHTVFDSCAEIRKEVEKKIKQLENNDYGDAVIDIGIIFMIEEDAYYKEMVKYSKKNRDIEVRARINYQQFFDGDFETKKTLYIKRLIESIREIGKKVKSGFNAEKLERDILEVLEISQESLFWED